MRTIALALLLVSAPAAAQDWVPAWTAPPIGYEPEIRDGLGRPFRNETVRQEVYVGIAGERLRVRLTNELGAAPLSIGGVSVVRLDGGGKPIGSTLRRVTFAGQRGVVVSPGAPFLSDAVALPVTAGARIAVSIHYPGEAAPPAHAQMVDVAPGDQVGAVTLSDARRHRASGLVSAVEVEADRPRVLVAFGDSITEGAGTTPGKGMSWPQQLQKMLAADPAGRCWAVANAGISGNRLLNEGRGPNALARFDRDVLGQSGVTHVVLLEGINDIGTASEKSRPDRRVDAERIIAAHRQLLARARSAGLKVIAGTLLPYEGAAYADAAGEKRRQTVNGWIRDHASEYDAVIDFDAAMREPGRPTVMRRSQQTGDNLHPNDAGYTTMARTALPVILAQGCGG